LTQTDEIVIESIVKRIRGSDATPADSTTSSDAACDSATDDQDEPEKGQ
jgi:hypothetical protein